MENAHPRIAFVDLKKLKETLSPHINTDNIYEPIKNPRDTIHSKRFIDSKRKKPSMHLDIQSVTANIKPANMTSQNFTASKIFNTTFTMGNPKHSRHSSQKTLDTTATKDTYPTLETQEQPTVDSQERKKIRSREMVKSLSALKINPISTREKKKIKLSPLKSPPRELLASIYNPRYGEFEIKRENLWQTAKKKYTTANKIIRLFDSLGTAKGPMLKGMLGDTPKNEESKIFSIFQNTKDSLLGMIRSVDLAIENRRYKLALDQHLTEVVNHAQKARNIEIYLAALKAQGKILLIYSDIHKALGVFKTIKHLADTNKSFTNKLKAYKYLGKCFQAVGNHKMAIFYFVKLLQTAWFCNSTRFELLAYDLMGVQFYYLGELERAKYYHEKMMSGKTEPKNSELRRLGIDKLTNNLLEGQAVKKNFRVKTIEEELTSYSIPQSEDEFELPSPRDFRQDSEQRDLTSKESNFFQQSRMKKVRSLKKVLESTLTGISNKKKKTSSVPRFSEHRDLTKLTLIVKTNESIYNPPNQPIILSHLSPNRLLNNFHVRDPHFLANSYINKGDIEEGLTLLDIKSLDTIKRKLQRLKQNAEKALIHMSSLGKFSHIRRISDANQKFMYENKNQIDLFHTAE